MKISYTQLRNIIDYNSVIGDVRWHMVSVKKIKGQSKDSLLRQFIRSVGEEGNIDVLKDRSFFKPPSLVKKERSKEAARKKRSARD